jgi:predicted acyl esterase
MMSSITTVAAPAPRPVETRIAVRDGARLAADLYLPEVAEPVPALLAASPYQKALRHLPHHPLFPFRETGPIGFYVANGYAYVWLDLRGTGQSAGEWTFGGRQEAMDLYDVIEWIAAQPWCSGRVGMIGQSYFAMAQWNATRLRPPHLRCIAPYDGNVDVYRDFLYHGGIPSTGFVANWSARLALLHQATGQTGTGEPGLRDGLLGHVLRHPLDDEWMRDRSPFWDLSTMELPVFSIGCWGKGPLHLRGNIIGFERVVGPRSLLVVDADGVAQAQRLFDDVEFHRETLLPWYDHYLRSAGPTGLPRKAVTLWARGAEEWRILSSWPPTEAVDITLYLSGAPAGHARSINDGSLQWQPPVADTATSWPYPRPEWQLGVSAMGENGLPDPTRGVTTWTTQPLETDLELTGPAVLELYLSSDQLDTDVYVTVRDVPPQPHGRPALVTQGWLRASHRAEDPTHSTMARPFHTHRDPQPLRLGVAHLVRVELLPMCYVLAAGHRLRLEITNGDSPVTASGFTHDYGIKVGIDTYHHSARYPSCLRLTGAG